MFKDDNKPEKCPACHRDDGLAQNDGGEWYCQHWNWSERDGYDGGTIIGFF